MYCSGCYYYCVRQTISPDGKRRTVDSRTKTRFPDFSKIHRIRVSTIQPRLPESIISNRIFEKLLKRSLDYEDYPLHGMFTREFSDFRVLWLRDHPCNKDKWHIIVKRRIPSFIELSLDRSIR